MRCISEHCKKPAQLKSGEQYTPTQKPIELLTTEPNFVSPQVIENTGATRRDRTGDLLITNQPLYQLS
jgi:hypothetical protein